MHYSAVQHTKKQHEINEKVVYWIKSEFTEINVVSSMHSVDINELDFITFIFQLFEDVEVHFNNF